MYLHVYKCSPTVCLGAFDWKEIHFNRTFLSYIMWKFICAIPIRIRPIRSTRCLFAQWTNIWSICIVMITVQNWLILHNLFVIWMGFSNGVNIVLWNISVINSIVWYLPKPSLWPFQSKTFKWNIMFLHYNMKYKAIKISCSLYRTWNIFCYKINKVINLITPRMK